MTVRSPRWRRCLVGALLVLAAQFLAACADNPRQSDINYGNLPQDFLAPIGRWAVEVDRLWNLVLVIAIGIFVLVQGLLLFSIFRYRERPGDRGRLPRQIHGNPRLEIFWTVVPTLLLFGVAVPTFQTLFQLSQRPVDALRVNITGHQWWWEVEYPDYPGLETANIVHIPTGREVYVQMTSADVIHSFWVPKLNGKQDVVPGHITTLKLQTDQSGEYFGQCAEYCGLSHANMRLRVIAQSPSDFEAWARQQSTPQRGQPGGALAAAGRQRFVDRGCVGCHSVRGFDQASGQVGPDLTYFSDRGWFAGAIFENNDQHLRDWLQDPPRMKPMAPENGQGIPNLGLSAQDVDQLVAFLRTLRSP